MLKATSAGLPFMILLFFLMLTTARGQEPQESKPAIADGYQLARLFREIESGKQELAKLNLKHSPKTIYYIETLKRTDGVGSKRKVTDFAWKEIGLKLMNLENGKTKVIKIKKAGPKLLNLNADFVITIEARPSGITWNGKNTAFKVQGLKNGGKWAVIKIRCPRRLKNGRRKDDIYAPHSVVLSSNALAAYGTFLFANVSQQSVSELERLDQSEMIVDPYLSSLKNIKEHAVTGVELPALERKMTAGPVLRLFLMEQSEPFEAKEFISGRSSFNPFQRVVEILALNGWAAYATTSSPAAASGPMQFTNKTRGRKLGTWDVVRKKYPWAELPPFRIGAGDYTESIKAAYLLTHLNFKILEKAFGSEILDDPKSELYLAAMYNGGEGPVVKAIKNSRRNGTDWRKELRKLKKTNESLDYLAKLDYLIKNPQIGSR